jgi:hypothetical protein
MLEPAIALLRNVYFEDRPICIIAIAKTLLGTVFLLAGASMDVRVVAK